MLSKDIIIQAIEQKMVETDYFLIDVKISPSNEVVVEIDSDSAVDLDFCVALSRHIEEVLNRDTEDFSLEVGSYGITKEFAVLRQYVKNIGQNVEILSKSGIKLRGKLSEVCSEYFAVKIEKRVKIEGKKRKIPQTETKKFYYNEVKYCKLHF